MLADLGIYLQARCNVLDGDIIARHNVLCQAVFQKKFLFVKVAHCRVFFFVKNAHCGVLENSDLRCYNVLEVINMLKYKIDIIDQLQKKGYTLQRIRKEKILSQGTLTYIRAKKLIRIEVIERICELLQCQPGDLLEWVPDDIE